MPLAATRWVVGAAVVVVTRKPYVSAAATQQPSPGRSLHTVRCSGGGAGDEVARRRVRRLRVRLLRRDGLGLLHRLAELLQVLAADGLADLREHLPFLFLDVVA